jgi:riboflavin synthase
MFTGIVEAFGQVIAAPSTAAGPAHLTIRARGIARKASPGDSIAVNGVCLTIARPLEDGTFTVEVMTETLRRSTLGQLGRGDRVNLERALTPSGLIGGHIVQGHVDGTARIRSRHDGPGGPLLAIDLPDGLAHYLIPRGSIAVDGVSLTVVDLRPGCFTVSLVHTTLAATTLGRIREGDQVNIEVDVVARLVERQLATAAASRHRGLP